MPLGTEHFKPKELECHHCGVLQMNPKFMSRLEVIRQQFGFPMILSSAYRCPEHDKAIGGAGIHTQGHAVDVKVYGPRAYRIVELAIRFGMKGIGVHQRGDMDKRFIHLDDLENGAQPRPRIWTYG